MQLTGEQLIKAYLSMCTIRKFGECMHKEFTTRQIPGLVRSYAITHRRHGHSIAKGAES
jgi:TPP-dependent pyruvate/acetoin dehydrogenase alpha subunit